MSIYLFADHACSPKKVAKLNHNHERALARLYERDKSVSSKIETYLNNSLESLLILQ